MQTTLKIPDKESMALAHKSSEVLNKFLSEIPEQDRARISVGGSETILPKSAIELFQKILLEIGQGNAVSIVPRHMEMTTQLAAEFLNVSRPYLVKLLEQGTIPFTKTGSHRRVQLNDLINYKENQKAESAKALTELTQQAQELNMGY